MGLDFSHCNARWSYSGFSRFRERLAEKVGFNLRDTEGFGGSVPWSSLPYDDIFPLLNHSDCDGELTPKECGSVAHRLRELVQDWDDSDYDKIKALELAEGMEIAASLGENLEFR